MKKIRQPYEYIPKYDIDSVKTKSGKVIESEDLLDGAYMIKRKKKSAAPKKVKLKWDDAAEKIMNAESDIWDDLNIQSGSQLYGDKELQKKYIAAAGKLDDIFLASNNKEKTLDKLTDENYHRVRQYLGMKYIPKEREDYEKMYKQYPNTMLVPDFIKQEFKKGGTLLSFRTKSINEKAEELVGSSTWNELNSQEKEETISELVSDGVLTTSFAFGGDVSAPVSTKISQEELLKFVDYVEGYYGKDGIFKKGEGFTKDEIKNAVHKYLSDLYKSETWGHGDTVDRERVRMYLETSELKEDDYIWNEMGKKFIVDKVTDEYYLMSGFKNAKLKIRKEVVHEGLKKGEFTLYPKFARGGVLTNDVYVFEVEQYGDIKRAEVRTSKGQDFAKKMIKDSYGIPLNKIKLVRQVQSDGYFKEGIYDFITVKAKGGGVDSEIRGGIRYVKGKDLEWHDIMSFDIADYGEEEAEKMAYKYVKEYIKYWNGELNDNDFKVKKSRNGKDFKGSWVVMRQFPKYAKGGGVVSNTEVILTENRPNGLIWRGVVKPFMLESIEENQYSGGFKRYDIDIYDEVEREPSKKEIKEANEFFDKIGGRYAKGGGVAEAKYLVTFEINGTKKEKSFDSKEKADSFVELMSDEEDVKQIKIEEIKQKETSLFGLAKAAPPKAASKREKESVQVNGIATDIARYDELKEIINNAKAEQELIGGALKQVGKQKFLEMYQQRGMKPDNFNLSDADEKIMFIVMDKYKKVEPEKAAILQNYDGLLETITTYSFNPEVLERIGETVSKIIMESKLLSDEDKRNLLVSETTVGIKKGSVDRLMQYEDPAVVFDLIEPILALK